MTSRILSVLVLALALPAAVLAQDGPMQEVKRGSKTIHVFNDARDTKVQAVVPEEWSFKLPPIENRPTVYLQIGYGPRDIEIDFHRTPGQDPVAYLEGLEGQFKPNIHTYKRETTEKIFTGRPFDTKKPLPFFATGEKAHLLAFSGIRMFIFEDPATKKREVKPDPSGKVMQYQLWAVQRQVGQASYLYLWIVTFPDQGLDRSNNLNRPSLEAISDLFRSIRFLR